VGSARRELPALRARATTNLATTDTRAYQSVPA
jgi:hypothetical protein